MEPATQPTTYFFKEVPASAPPLFHYTDAGGLLGMVQYKKLWLTNIHYQNDNEEFYYAINLAKEVLDEHYPGVFRSDKFDNLVKSMVPLFSFSLSEEKDSLSQWRGYAPDGGYAISFENSMLNDTIKQEGLELGKCIYDRDEQKRAILNSVIPDEIRQYYQRGAKNNMRLSNRARDLHYYAVNSIIKIASLIKHPSFSEEKEWRLVKNLGQYLKPHEELTSFLASNIHDSSVKIRARKNLLIPYAEVFIHDWTTRMFNIKEIMVGPTPHKQRAVEACRVLLSINENYPLRVQVNNSSIPYVNW